MITKTQLETNIAAARLYLLNNAPFFGALLYGTTININEDENAPSCAWTNGQEIFFNIPQMHTVLEETVAKKEVKTGPINSQLNRKKIVFECITFLVIHELMHCMFLHLDRRKDRDPLLWNYAADLTINNLINSWFNLTNPEGIVLSIPNMYDNTWNESAEHIYDILNKNKPELSYDPETGKGKISYSDGTSQEVGLDIKDEGLNKDEMKDKWESCIENAKSVVDDINVKGASSQSKSLETLLEELYDPKVDWRQLIDHLGGELAKGDFSFRRQSKSSIGTNYYLPSMHTYEPFVVVAIDTSGSITTEEYKRFMSETQSILSMHNCKVGVIQCDSEVTDYVELNTNDSAPPLKGGGGTRFGPVFEYMDKVNSNIDALIYFTDGFNYDHNFHEELYVSYPIVWVMTTTVKAPKIGRSLLYDTCA
tara:strand:+ start:7041 stop:8309 length:1269 start_codon:yes stop_codon:yes gene_type:complete